jgi:hypothetical protein
MTDEFECELCSKKIVGDCEGCRFDSTSSTTVVCIQCFCHDKNLYFNPSVDIDVIKREKK